MCVAWREESFSLPLCLSKFSLVLFSSVNQSFLRGLKTCQCVKVLWNLMFNLKHFSTICDHLCRTSYLSISGNYCILMYYHTRYSWLLVVCSSAWHKESFLIASFIVYLFCFAWGKLKLSTLLFLISAQFFPVGYGMLRNMCFVWCRRMACYMFPREKVKIHKLRCFLILTWLWIWWRKIFPWLFPR